MFNERYGLQSAVFEGRKTQTRREPFYSDGSVCCEFNRQGRLECFTYDDESEYLIHTSRYAKGEIVAVAQRYSEIADEMKDAICVEELGRFYVKPFIDTKGWNNKMFVRADLMPHHIKITDIRCERLQDISESDCIKEGVLGSAKNSFYIVDYKTTKVFRFYTAKECFLYLLNLVSKKEHRNINPYVIVYEFELVD